MKKHTRAVALLGSCAMTLAAAGFGFSKWSSNITLNGNVTANGTWDVAITDASISRISTGTKASGEESITAPKYEVTVYDVYADYCTDFNPSWTYYRVHIDDLHPHTIEMTEEEFNEYNYRCFVSGNVMVGYNFYESGLTGDNLQYMMKMNDLAYSLGFDNGVQSAKTDDASYDGAFLGTAIGEHLAGKKNPWNVPIIYNEVAAFFETAQGYPYYKAVISDDKQSAAFADVNLGLPGAWAEYSVTVKNNGTAYANVADLAIDLDTESEILTINKPSLAADGVLAPGESCSFTFVVSAADTTEDLNETGTVKVSLKYVQDTVEEAPDPTHSHN